MIGETVDIVGTAISFFARFILALIVIGLVVGTGDLCLSGQGSGT